MTVQEKIKKAREKALGLLKPTKAQWEHGLSLHRESIVVDAFGFAPYTLSKRAVDMLNALNDGTRFEGELYPKQLELNVTEQGFCPEAREQYQTAWDESGVTATMQTSGGPGLLANGFRHFSRFFYVWHKLPDIIRQAVKPEDVITAKKENIHCQFLSLNGLPGLNELKDDQALEMIQNVYFFGVRMMHLSYNLRNKIGGGCIEKDDPGLTDFGKEVIHRMNQIGILVDTPHTGRKTTMESAKISSSPIAASHTACCSVYDHDRGKTDKEIKAIAGTGGFIGICCYPNFLADLGTILDLLNHIDYAVKLVGADYIAIGTDIAFSAPPPVGYDLKPFPKNEATAPDPLWRPEHFKNKEYAFAEIDSGSLAWTNWPLFTVGLVQRGYSDEDIKKIIGGNVLRVLKNVADCASR